VVTTKGFLFIKLLNYLLNNVLKTRRESKKKKQLQTDVFTWPKREAKNPSLLLKKLTLSKLHYIKKEEEKKSTVLYKHNQVSDQCKYYIVCKKFS